MLLFYAKTVIKNIHVNIYWVEFVSLHYLFATYDVKCYHLIQFSLIIVGTSVIVSTLGTTKVVQWLN